MAYLRLELAWKPDPMPPSSGVTVLLALASRVIVSYSLGIKTLTDKPCSGAGCEHFNAYSGSIFPRNSQQLSYF